MKHGDIIIFDNVPYKVVKGIDAWDCSDCDFYSHGCTNTGLIPECIHTDNLIFKRIKDMKEIKIEIPKGYVIDQKNSDLTNGIIKFKKEDINLIDIFAALGADNTIIPVVKINSKLDAIANLMYIAKYYNGDWVPSVHSLFYYIAFNIKSNDYYIAASTYIKYGVVYFKSEADAQAVIDNPNFRHILDVIYKN